MNPPLLRFYKIFFIFLFLGIGSHGWTAFEIFPKISYFRPKEKLVREIYSDHIGSYGLEVRQLWWCLPAGVFFSGDYTLMHGRSLGGDNSTSLQISNGYAGLLITPFSFFGQLNLNIGAGGAATFMRIKDNSDFVNPKLRKSTIGWIVKGDLSYHFCCLLLDVFAEYTSSEFSFEGGPAQPGKVHLNTGGYRFGGGAGIRF